MNDHIDSWKTSALEPIKSAKLIDGGNTEGSDSICRFNLALELGRPGRELSYAFVTV